MLYNKKTIIKYKDVKYISILFKNKCLFGSYAFFYYTSDCDKAFVSCCGHAPKVSKKLQT